MLCMRSRRRCTTQKLLRQSMIHWCNIVFYLQHPLTLKKRERYFVVCCCMHLLHSITIIVITNRKFLLKSSVMVVTDVFEKTKNEDICVYNNPFICIFYSEWERKGKRRQNLCIFATSTKICVGLKLRVFVCMKIGNFGVK